MNELKTLARKHAIIKGILHHIEWDQETFMPEGGAESRADQIQWLAGHLHNAATSDEYKNALNKLIDIQTGTVKIDCSDSEKAALREWRKDFVKDTAIPLAFVEEFSALTSRALEAWKIARKENDFSKFEPFLEKIVEMNKRKAEFLGYSKSPYDALLDVYEPGLTADKVEKVFSLLKEKMPDFVRKIKNKPCHLSMRGPYSEQDQLHLSQEILKRMGYDFKHGRIDISTHPFSTSEHPTDCRVTTRLDKNDPISNILTTMHEGGHALYEMGLPAEHFGSPLAESVSLGIHESQSRFWETRIGLSLPFWKGFLPTLQKSLKGLENATPEEVYNFVNKVEPSFIRVESDEVTYPLHVILRFEIEKDLIEGKLKAADVPKRWNELMHKYLGVTPPDDAKGCLQDIHWSMGSFGYFPTYALGTMYSAQLFEKFEETFPDWSERVENGDLLFIKKWLNENIHRYGRQYSPEELLKKATGKEFSSEPFLRYIENKYINAG
jgi:carboxypeptidase Taq